MSVFYDDLERMVLERVQPKELREVSRVNKKWRQYIKTNVHRMRSFPCDSMTFGFKDKGKKWIKSVRIVSGARPWGLDFDESSDESMIYKYQPTKEIDFRLDFFPMVFRGRQHLHDMINSIPTWWLSQVGKVRCIMNDIIFCPVISHIRHITMFCTLADKHEDAIAHSKQIIMSSQRVDRFGFYSDNNHDLSTLYAIIEKSQIYPTEYPIGLGKLSFETFKYFLDNNNFTSADIHEMSVFLTGSRQTFDNWKEESTVAFEINNFESVCSLSHAQYSREYIYYNFIYRGLKFSVRVWNHVPEN